MKKTLKTFINAGLLMLSVSHSYGLVYNISDVNRAGGQADYGVMLMDNTTHSRFNGIDDTFDGSVTFNFTLTYTQYQTGGTYVLFQLQNRTVGTPIVPIAIGNTWTSDNWGGIRNTGFITDLTFGSNPVVVGESKAFTMTIDYNAGALDTGTLMIDGDSTVHDIGEFDYTFNEIMFFNGFGGSFASATDISVEVVPEPATYALIFGALAFGFVAVPRRFKA